MRYVSGGVTPVAAWSGVDMGVYKVHLAQFTAQKSGYLYVFCSNESNFPVFFDNLSVRHTPGPVLEETHYYPFGLTIAGISSKAAGALINRKKFNDGTELQSQDFSDGSGLELYATNYRSLDPQLGRFWQIDPLAEAHPNLNSYAYVNNNPLRYNDPLGLDTVRVSGEGSHKIKVRQGDVLAWTIGETTSYYTYDPNNKDAVNGFVGGGMDGGTMDEVKVTGKAGKSSPAALPLWMDPAVSGAEYQIGKVLDRYGSDGYGRGRPFWPGPAQRVFDRNFPKGSYANTRPINLHLPLVNRSVQAPRYIVSATGQVLKFVGVASAAVNGISTEIQYANGEISNAHRWTNHAMTVIGFMGPGGVAVSLIYSAVVEDMIFKGNAPTIWKSDWVEMGLMPPAF